MLQIAEVSEVAQLTVAGFFSKVAETTTGLLTGAVGVFTGLWESGVPGQVVCSLGFATMAIGLGCALFRIKKRRH